MERLRLNVAFDNTVATSMTSWLEAIKTVQRRRRQEIVNAANAGVKMMIKLQQDDKDVVGLTEAIKELTGAERKARTALWAALQITIDDAEKLNNADNATSTSEI